MLNTRRSRSGRRSPARRPQRARRTCSRPSCSSRRSRPIRGIGGRAAVISITRLMNQGLLLISPMLLTRFLSVEEFGQYREFLLYATVLEVIASYNIFTSLLRFVAHHPEHRQQFVDQAVLMTLGTSTLVVVGTAVLNWIFQGALVGDFMLPLGVLAFVYVNFDYWEHMWLTQRRIGAVFAYTTGRLIARMVTVVTAAWLSSDVQVIIWSLVTLEAARFLGSFFMWARYRQGGHRRLESGWREQLRFCGPTGAAHVLVGLNKSMSSLYVAKLLGPVALAHFAIGTYMRPIITVLRNSMSDVLLPEISSQVRSQPHADSLLLWRRMTVVAAILMVPAAVLLGRFAETIVVTLFTEEYREAVPVFQIYLLVLFREVVDFAVPLRAINRTAPLMYGNLVSLVSNAILLAILLPTIGLIGAAAAFVLARMIEGVYQGRQTAKAYGIAARELVRWRDVGKVALAAALASITLATSFWTSAMGLLGVVAAGCCFMAVYVLLLLLLRVPEAVQLKQRLRLLVGQALA
ncbi:MAG TPA: oligosaccharide flippase family protein [Steroidobacteraceae bacterium]|nr:oligosaccharide flippase family protein [Steroidobacteraceae bacterium]